MKKNTKLELSLIVTAIVSAMLAFYAIHRAIKVADSSTWIVPMLWISIFIISISLACVTVRKKMEIELLIISTFLLNLIFAFSLGHVAVIAAAIFLMLSALHRIREDLDLNVRISLWKSLYAGKFKMILALALIISSQYFFTIKSMQGQINIPKLDLSGVTMRIIEPLLKSASPAFETILAEDLTVDQYIIKSQQQNTDSDFAQGLDFTVSEEEIESQIPRELPAAKRDLLKQQALEKISDAKAQLSEKNHELILIEGRRQLSKTVGQELTGQEKIADVIVSPISKAVNDYFQMQVSQNNQSPVFPIILTAVLFLTILPLGSLLSSLWFGIAVLIFKVLVKFEIIKVREVTVQREMIA